MGRTALAAANGDLGIKCFPFAKEVVYLQRIPSSQFEIERLCSVGPEELTPVW